MDNYGSSQLFLSFHFPVVAKLEKILKHKPDFEIGKFLFKTTLGFYSPF